MRFFARFLKSSKAFIIESHKQNLREGALLTMTKVRSAYWIPTAIVNQLLENVKVVKGAIHNLSPEWNQVSFQLIEQNQPFLFK